MWILRSATIGAGLALFATGAEAQYFFFYSSSYSEGSSSSSLTASTRKIEGPIKRAYINKYGHVVVTAREKSEPAATGAGEAVTQPVRPAPRASR